MPLLEICNTLYEALCVFDHGRSQLKESQEAVKDVVSIPTSHLFCHWCCGFVLRRFLFLDVFFKV